jgi:GNAT superfamily N-acetyltransferase
MMRQAKTTGRPMLRPEHFGQLRTQLTGAGLRFRKRIGHEDREAECPTFDEAHLAQIAAARPSSLVVVNPRRPSVRSLSLILRTAQREAMPGEKIGINYGLPKRYDKQWAHEIQGNTRTEGQNLVVVIYDSAEPIGYAGMEVSISWELHDRSVYLRFSPELVYVRPKSRGRGFGLDLSIACGFICSDLLKATYRAVPSGTEIETCVYADYESEGGEAFADHLHSCLEVGVDDLSEYGKRKSIRLRGVDLDAGY